MTWAPEPEAPSDEPEPPFDEPEAQAAPAVASAPAAAKAAPAAKFTRNEDERYGESLLREMLGAKPIADKNGK
jgi:3-oxoacyl-ACP reductase-like protein